MNQSAQVKGQSLWQSAAYAAHKPGLGLKTNTAVIQLNIPGQNGLSRMKRRYHSRAIWSRNKAGLTGAARVTCPLVLKAGWK
jgi:hypothetical protein